MFPVPARAAICSFEMVTSDGLRLECKIKEINEVRHEYEEALQENKVVALLEQVRLDSKSSWILTVVLVNKASDSFCYFSGNDFTQGKLNSHNVGTYSLYAISRLV